MNTQEKYRHIDLLRSAPKLLTLSFLIACVACGEGSRQSADAEATKPVANDGQRESKRSSITQMEIDGKILYRLPLGDTVFLIPSEISTPAMSTLSFTLFFSWPELRILKGYGQADLKHFIHLVVGGSSNPMPGFGKNKVESWIKGGNVAAASLNGRLGLIEYRQVAPGWSWYLSPDVNYVGPGGQRPYVMCEPTPSKEWANTRKCRVDQFLSSQVDYYYVFSDELLSDWPKIDVEIRNFLLSMTEKKN